LTRQLLAFARKQVVEPRVLDLNEVVASMLRMVQRLIGEHIVLQWKPSADAATVRMDPAQVDQVLANLCVNARDAIGQQPGRIVIETGVVRVDPAAAALHEGVEHGDFVLLTITDDGCGMAPDVRAHLFEPFFTTKAVGEGTGLGLATVYGIVRQNGGFIEVRSQPGAGTAFLIHLPGHHEASAPVAKPAPPPMPRGQGTVLLVEDEPAILRMTTAMLGRLGYTVLAAGSPREALELAAAAPGQVDLLVTDVVMPQMNGRDLAARLVASQPAMKRLFMSGYTADVIAHQGVLDAGVSFLQKPFTMRELGKKTREALEQ
jgi:CheY-like chemotaxis protein